jgi:hypothetical protein
MSVCRRRFIAFNAVFALQLPATVPVSAAIVGAGVSFCPLVDVAAAWACRREFVASVRYDTLDYDVVAIIGALAPMVDAAASPVALVTDADEDSVFRHSGVMLWGATVRAVCNCNRVQRGSASPYFKLCGVGAGDTGTHILSEDGCA